MKQRYKTMFCVCPPPLPLRRRGYLFFKSASDRLTACLLLIPFVPFLLLTAFLSAMETGHWPIMLAPYLGCRGKLILRAVPSPAVKEKAGAWTNLAAGRFFSFLLSVFSVASGEMSFVGPAPVPASDAPAICRRMSCGSAALRPGLTGLWDLKDKMSRPTAGGLDRFYYYGCSLRMDVGILMASLARRAQSR